MSYSIITLITPNEYVPLCGQLVNIHEIETIKLNQNGNIIYFTKRSSTSYAKSYYTNEEQKEEVKENLIEEN